MMKLIHLILANMKKETAVIKNTALEIANIFHLTNETALNYLKSALEIVYLEGAIDQLTTNLKIKKETQ